MKRYHFISGLPRSGSTLLSAILNQNPRFTASISDPLLEYVQSIISSTENSVGVNKLIDNKKRKRLMHGLFDTFYSEDNEVCFNTNRGWTAKTDLLRELYPDFKMIVCLREIEWILDSFEQLHRKNPYTIKPLYAYQETINVYERCRILMGETVHPAYVALPLANIKQALFCDEISNILFIEYEALAKTPESVMKAVYSFLDEEYFQHNFDSVESSYDEFDDSAKIKGLHTTRKKVEYLQRQSIIPQDIINRHSLENFWKLPDFDYRMFNWIKYKPAIPTNIAV